MDEGMSFFIGLLIGTCMTSFIFVNTWGAQNAHPDTWGTYMCEQHGLEFDHIDLWEGTDNKFEFKAYCKNTTKIDDGYLVVTG